MGLYEELKESDKLDPIDVAGVYNLTLFNKSSGPRLHLTGTYFEQYVVLNQPEVPRMYTGFEKELGSYNESLKIAKVPYKILHRIEKFPSHPGIHYTLIVQDMISGIIGIIENKHYENLAEEHGYFKPMIDVDYKGPGNVIENGSVLSKAETHDEYLNYRYGINANVAYISRKEDIEDGIIISESFANRVSYASIKTVEVTLGFNDILLNVYGDDVIYRSFPDIFTEVKDGIFCVKRSIDHFNAGCNTTTKSLMNIDTNDEIFHADGKLLDVEIFVNSNVELAKDNGHRQQIITYYNIVKDYKFRVMKALEPYVRNVGVKLTTEANTRYNSYKNYIDACNNPDSNIKFANATGTFEFAFLKFTIGRNVKLSRGSKLTNRFGGKGVVCSVLPDDIMPKDKYGNVAEVIINPCGVVGRSNPGQLYEQELNFISDRVVELIKKEDTLPKKYGILSKFFSITDKDSAEEFERFYRSLPIPAKHKYFNNIVENGIYVRQHPAKNLSFEGMKKLYTEFNVKPSRVELGVRLSDGSVKKYESKNPVVIGKEYMLVLKHTAGGKFSSVSISDVNSIGLPHKSTTKHKNLPYRNTPIKFGEMEVNIAINRCDPLIVNRLLAGNGSNLKHRDRVSKMLLEEDPLCYHNIDIRNEDIVDNIGSDAFVAIMRQLGYCIYADTFEETLEVGENPNNNHQK